MDLRNATCAANPHARAARADLARRCARVSRACVVGEQLVLHGTSSGEAENLRRVMDDLPDVKLFQSRLRAQQRRSVVLASELSQTPSYLPLALMARNALRLRNRSSNGKLHAALWQTRPQSAPRPSFSLRPAVVFFTTYPMSIIELYVRAVVLLDQAECEGMLGGDRERARLFPSMWEPSLRFLLDPYALPGAVQPLAPLPAAEELDTIHNADGSPAFWKAYDRYVAGLAPFQRAREGAGCFETVHVCDFANSDLRYRTARPWHTMQHWLQHRGYTYDPAPRLQASPSGPLRVVFVRRSGRRRISNLAELHTECGAWRPERVTCEKHDLGALGMDGAAKLMRRTDVLVSMHGADLINGLMMHAGATVVEITPVVKANCPCDMLRPMFLAPADRAMQHIRLDSTNRSHMSGPLHGTMHADHFVPWPSIRRALETVLDIGGRADAFDRWNDSPDSTIPY